MVRASPPRASESWAACESRRGLEESGRGANIFRTMTRLARRAPARQHSARKSNQGQRDPCHYLNRLGKSVVATRLVQRKAPAIGSVPPSVMSVRGLIKSVQNETPPPILRRPLSSTP